MSHKLGKKALMCLAIAASHPKFKPGELFGFNTWDAWERIYHEASVRFSEKAIICKMEDLADKGYIEYGVSARTGWLTPKGEQALRDVPDDELWALLHPWIVKRASVSIAEVQYLKEQA